MQLSLSPKFLLHHFHVVTIFCIYIADPIHTKHTTHTQKKNNKQVMHKVLLPL